MTQTVSATPREVERWFVRRGYGTLLSDTGLGVKSAVRAVPVMIALFVIMMMLIVPSAAKLSFGGESSKLWLAILISTAALVGTWVVGNLVRRRPPFAKIVSIGWVEMVAFVAVPTITFAINPQGSAFVDDNAKLAGLVQRVVLMAAIAIVQIVLLVLVLSLIRLRVISITTVMLRELFGTVADTATVMARTLPLLLGVITFIYFTTEVWQTFGELPPLPYSLSLLIFIAMSLLFLLRREHLDLDNLSAFETPEDLREALADTPLANAEVSHIKNWPISAPLSAQHERNLLVVAAISRLVVATVVGLAVLGFFFLLGFIVVDAVVIKSWLTHAPDTIASWTFAGHTYDLTRQHLKVVGFLAVFSGFYYAVVSATDPSLRQGIADSTQDQVREVCAARVVLLNPAKH